MRGYKRWVWLQNKAKRLLMRPGSTEGGKPFMGFNSEGT